ncbi:MAG: NAD(P)H-hydrate epimerase, partial [Chloroflexota bacterium]
MKVLTAAQMRQVEQDCARMGLPAGVLMQNAGQAVATEVKRLLGTLENHRILLLIGPGNNGGDGLVAAHHLH